MDAAESVYTEGDMENALWGETPETNYFKMMMEHNGMGRDGTDDSVLGGETLASVMGDKYAPNHKGRGVDSTQSVDSYSTTDEMGPPPPETMSIVGLEDDVSTIANDTVGEAVKGPKTRNRLFDDNRSSLKAKKRSESSTENAEEEEILPGLIKVPGKSKKGDVDAGGEGQKMDRDDTPPFRSKRVYLAAAVLAIILFSSVIALSVALKGMRDSGSTSTTSSATADEGDSGSVLDDWPELNATINDPPLNGTITDPPRDETIVEPEAPVDEIPVALPTAGPTAVQGTPVLAPTAVPTTPQSPFEGEFSVGHSLEPTSYSNNENLTTYEPSMAFPTSEPSVTVNPAFEPSTVMATTTFEPSAVATTIVPSVSAASSEPSAVVTTTEPSAVATTIAPSSDDLETAAVAEMLSVLVDRGAVSVDVADSPDSPQYQALTWLSQDPSYSEYGEDRAVQRWALAVVALTVAPPSMGGPGRRAQMGILPGWMEYSDECTWYTAGDVPICNSMGMYESIDMHDLFLKGSVPRELALMSNSLRKFSKTLTVLRLPRFQDTSAGFAGPTCAHASCPYVRRIPEPGGERIARTIANGAWQSRAPRYVVLLLTRRMCLRAAFLFVGSKRIG
jgi:hypothetical protein